MFSNIRFSNFNLFQYQFNFKIIYNFTKLFLLKLNIFSFKVSKIIDLENKSKFPNQYNLSQPIHFQNQMFSKSSYTYVRSILYKDQNFQNKFRCMKSHMGLNILLLWVIYLCNLNWKFSFSKQRYSNPTAFNFSVKIYQWY